MDEQLASSNSQPRNTDIQNRPSAVGNSRIQNTALATGSENHQSQCIITTFKVHTYVHT